MEFRIEKAAFLQALYYAQGIADRKSTMPILANVLLRSDGHDRILVAATDLNLTVTTELPCEVQSEGGLTASAKHLHDIVKSLPSDKLSLKPRGQQLRRAVEWQGELQGRWAARSRLPEAAASPRCASSIAWTGRCCAT
jgi:DNA polymerase III sliding clamp (beta) subunit (PCNA family)